MFLVHVGRTSKNWSIFFSKVAVHFYSGHPQASIINTSLCGVIKQYLLLTELGHYFNIYIVTNVQVTLPR